MQSQNCPKCGGEMDMGKISESLIYTSNCQTGLFKVGTLVDRTYACLTCGYVELYLNPEILKQKIQK